MSNVFTISETTCPIYLAFMFYLNKICRNSHQLAMTSLASVHTESLDIRGQPI